TADRRTRSPQSAHVRAQTTGGCRCVGGTDRETASMAGPQHSADVLGLSSRPCGGCTATYSSYVQGI
ncbi:hypothetical protein P7K49_039645, partial [Saguinus oedipus]